MTAPPLRALCLYGGGYLGLATAAFLKEVEEHFAVHSWERFQLFAGTSTGAIIAIALARGMTAAEVVDLYRGLRAEVFPDSLGISRRIRRVRGLVRSQYDNDALCKALTAAFGNETVGDIHAAGRSILVPAFCLTTGLPRVFKTDHSGDLTLHDRYKLVDVALASSAAPIYFPVAHVEVPTTEGASEHFVDGGLVANDPALLAYAECISHLGAKPQDIKLLSVSAPRLNLREPTLQSPKRGLAQWGTKLLHISIDGAAELSHQALRRICDSQGSHYVRFKLANAASGGAAVEAIDLATEDATNTLLSIGRTSASLRDTRLQLKQFFRSED